MESGKIHTIFDVLTRDLGLGVSDSLQVILKKQYGGVRPFAKSIGLSHTSVYNAIRNPEEVTLREQIAKALGFDPWSQGEEPERDGGVLHVNP